MNTEGLRYNSFSVVFLHIFSMDKINIKLFNPLYVNKKINEIDKQIFVIGEYEESPVVRYKLPSFNIKVDSNNPLEGEVFVECSMFFDRTISLSLRVVVNNKFVKTKEWFTTDQLIELIALNLGAEHWNSPSDKTASNINLDLPPVTVTNLKIDKYGEWTDSPQTINGEKDYSTLKEVCARYRKALLKGQNVSLIKPYNFAYVDIWEDIDNYNGSLQKMEKEEDIISFIYKERKKEMVGLMTLYPEEWPYRTEESFDDVCGGNIAIDTDDLILLNQNICVVFGTYGRRGKDSPTDWEKHLRERDKYHVSWPEYMLILEMVLAKKYTVAQARDYLLRQATKGAHAKSPRETIEANSSIEIQITQLLLKLDAVNYSKFMSHKVMFDRTNQRLEIEKEEQYLKNTMDKISSSLTSLCDMRSLRQANMLNIILGAISIASLFQIIFSNVEIPFLKYLGIEWANDAGLTLVGIAIFLIFAGIITLAIIMVQNGNIKRVRQLERSNN